MELKEHGKILGRYKILILILTILVGLSALAFSLTQESVYEASLAFTVNRINRQETSYYEYDGFYAIQAADLFSATVISWFLTPSFLLEIYDEAGLDPQINSLDRLGSRFRTKQYSSQNLVVGFKEKSRDRAEKISGAVIEKVETKSSELNKTADSRSLFEVVGSKPVIVEKRTNTWLATILGLISGFILGIIVVYLLRYFREPEEL